ncbi:MAG: alpha/beta fold hydrolase [Thermoplasmatota archaeon]
MSKPKKEIKFCKTPEGEIEYILTGKKNDETIVFIHGLGSNLRQFFPQQNYFSEDYKVLSLSLRGHGYSTKTSINDPKEFTIKKFKEDLVYVFRQLNIDKFHYVGNSMGGIIGYEYLKEKPESFHSLITFGTTAELNVSKISQKFISFINKVVFKLYGKNGYGEYLGRKSSTYPTTQRIMSHLFTLTDIETIVNCQKNISNYSYIKTLESTDVPILMIKGGKDDEINRNLGSTLEIFEKKDNLKIVEMERAGHFANLERSEEFNEILEDFIAKCSS